MIEFVYDQLNTWGQDDEFFLALLKSTQANSVADLGCGTGRVTNQMAKLGYEVTGIDPNEKAIKLAKQKVHGNEVRWIVGDSSKLETANYDVVIMTANVAQVFTTKNSWMSTLRDIYRALKPGGYLIFDTRNPNGKVWEEWEKDGTIDQLHDVNSGDLLSLWDEYEGLSGSIFTFNEYVKNERTNEIFVDKVQLIFRSYEELFESQKEVGFSDVKAYEDWQFKKATPQAKSFIFHSIK